MESGGYDDIPLRTVLCRQNGTTDGLQQMGRTILKIMVAVHGSPCVPTTRILILVFIWQVIGCEMSQNIRKQKLLFRIVFWDVLPCKMIVDRRFRGAYCVHHQGFEVSQKLL
jgi:hypothetical protein